MLLRDANPDAFSRAIANGTGPRGAARPLQLVLTALIVLADAHGVIEVAQIGRLTDLTASPWPDVENAIGLLTRDRWIGPSECGGVKLTGVLEGAEPTVKMLVERAEPFVMDDRCPECNEYEPECTCEEDGEA